MAIGCYFYGHFCQRHIEARTKDENYIQTTGPNLCLLEQKIENSFDNHFFLNCVLLQ